MENKLNDFVSIQLSKNTNTALYVQLYEQLRELILTGRLSEGYLMPPVRKFAGFLGINAGTVVSAYKQLEKNGCILSKGGSGSYVADVMDSGAAEDNEPENDFVARQMKAEADCINFASIALDPELISVEAIKNVLNEVLERDKGYAFSYQESQGFYPLRESIAQDLRRSGVQATPDNVQIISGAQQGIDIVSRCLLNYGDYVFIERPSYAGAIAAFRARGARIISINMEADGIDIDDLEEKLRQFRPKLIYVMPNIQNPTGLSYSVEKRNRLMGLARYYGVLILEDDYISELYYTDEPMAPLKALDRDERVIYLKSFSKIFMPGLRLAFLTMPAKLSGKLLSAKYTSDISTSGLTQRAFDMYLRKGIWHDHLSVIRRLYRERFELMFAMARKLEAYGVSIVKPSGGLSLWLELPEEISARQLMKLALEKKVLVSCGDEFFAQRAKDCYLRLSFATATLQEIRSGMLIVTKLLREWDEASENITDNPAKD